MVFMGKFRENLVIRFILTLANRLVKRGELGKTGKKDRKKWEESKKKIP